MHTSLPMRKSPPAAASLLLQTVAIQTGFLLLAAIVVLITQAHPEVALTRGPAAPASQLMVGLGIGAFLGGAAALAVLSTPWGQGEQLRLAATLRRWGPGLTYLLVNGVLAGLAAEFLFQAALQPLVGVWAAAALFALAETVCGQFSPYHGLGFGSSLAALVMGVIFGLLYQHLGLLAALMAHTGFRVIFLAVVWPVVRLGIP